MKLKDSFITQKTSRENIMVSTDMKVFSGLVRSNDSAAFIIECLKRDTTKEKIVAAMQKVYDAPKELFERDVDKIVEGLQSIGAIEE